MEEEEETREAIVVESAMKREDWWGVERSKGGVYVGKGED